MEDAAAFGQLDHIGARLWTASQTWKARFTEEMVAAGHGWYAEARSSVTPYIGAKGVRQADLVRAVGLTKQAVQQLVDDLEKEGIVERRPDPKDRRGKIVAFTDKGASAQRDADRVKLVVEAEFRQKLGETDYAQLFELLGRLGEGGD